MLQSWVAEPFARVFSSELLQEVLKKTGFGVLVPHRERRHLEVRSGKWNGDRICWEWRYNVVGH